MGGGRGFRGPSLDTKKGGILNLLLLKNKQLVDWYNQISHANNWRKIPKIEQDIRISKFCDFEILPHLDVEKLPYLDLTMTKS